MSPQCTKKRPDGTPCYEDAGHAGPCPRTRDALILFARTLVDDARGALRYLRQRLAKGTP